MCLITEQKEPIILTEDLTVYKIMDKVDGNFASVYHSQFIYKPNTLYKTEIRKDISGRAIAHDFVAYYEYATQIHLLEYAASNQIWEESLESKISDSEIIILCEGFHFATTSDRLMMTSLYGHLIHCLVPKGSEVYYDKSGLGVANQIIINKEN